MELSIVFSALALGFATGFHCVGMCGPIALSLGLSGKQAFRYQLHNLSYNLGRICMYGLLGAVLGFVGTGFHMAGLQKYLSIGVGILMVLMAIFSFGGKDFARRIPFINQKLFWVKEKLAKFIQKKNIGNRFITGLLNGLLPCGMVYVALTASVAMGSIWKSSLYMLLFGLGTVPFMFTLVLFGSVITQNFRQKFLQIVPAFMLIIGGLFILRGLELGIPYISPLAESLQVDSEAGMCGSTKESCH